MQVSAKDKLDAYVLNYKAEGGETVIKELVCSASYSTISGGLMTYLPRFRNTQIYISVPDYIELIKPTYLSNYGQLKSSRALIKVKPGCK